MFVICRGYHVIAIEIDPRKVEMAKNNAKIYGVDSHIDFIVGDFLQLAPYLKVLLVLIEFHSNYGHTSDNY